MAGTKGRSGGWNRKAASVHKLHGTWRKDRHGAAPAPALPTVSEPSEALLAGLGTDGQSFLRAVYVEYAPTAMEARVLRLAAEGFDDAAAARQRDDMKAARAAVRQVLAVLQRLGLPAPKVGSDAETKSDHVG